MTRDVANARRRLDAANLFWTYVSSTLNPQTSHALHLVRILPASKLHRQIVRMRHSDCSDSACYTSIGDLTASGLHLVFILSACHRHSVCIPSICMRMIAARGLHLVYMLSASCLDPAHMLLAFNLRVPYTKLMSTPCRHTTRTEAFTTLASLVRLSTLLS